MRLTDEDVRRHKENKYSVECVKGKIKMSDGDIIGNLCDTIEALQQEYGELDTGHSKLFKEFCGLKQEAEIQTINAKTYLQEAEQLRTQNGAMGGALKQAMEWIEAKSGAMSVYPSGQVMCSICKQRMPIQWKKMPPYCPNCGAKMGGREDV